MKITTPPLVVPRDHRGHTPAESQLRESKLKIHIAASWLDYLDALCGRYAHDNIVGKYRYHEYRDGNRDDIFCKDCVARLK